MKRSLESYRERRDALLTKITERLSNDERFVAAWLAGSLSRNDADFLSDIDLRVVLADEYSASLCTRLEQVSAQTSPERHALFSQFGNPSLIHENNNNAPEGGTFTFVLYAESAVMIDWVLVPQSKAMRPSQSRLLFEKAAIPMEPAPKPEDLEQSKKYVAEQWAFFWMMTAITIKYAVRNDGVFVTEWTEHLYNISYEIERRLNRESWKYTRGSLSKFQPARENQIESLRRLCNRMQGLKSRIAEFTGSEPLTPVSEIENFFQFAKDATHNPNPNRKSAIKNRKS
jgi:predicted nucleotidyltransferase